MPLLDEDPAGICFWVFDAMAVVQALVQILDTYGELAEHLCQQSNGRQRMLYELISFLTHIQKFN